MRNRSTPVVMPLEISPLKLSSSSHTDKPCFVNRFLIAITLLCVGNPEIGVLHSCAKKQSNCNNWPKYFSADGLA